MSTSPSGITVIKVKTVIDGTGSAPKNHQAVVIEGDSIREILPQDQLSFPEGTLVQTLNYPDGYLLPGLIDAHAHLMFGVPGATYEQVIEDYKYKMEKLGSDETIVYKVIIVALLLFIGYRYYLRK